MATRLNIDSTDLTAKAQEHAGLLATLAAGLGAYLAGLRRRRKPRPGQQHDECVDTVARDAVKELRNDLQQGRVIAAGIAGETRVRIGNLEDHAVEQARAQAKTNRVLYLIADRLGVQVED